MILNTLDTNKIIGQADTEAGGWIPPQRQAFALREERQIGRSPLEINTLLYDRLIAEPVVFSSAACSGPDITVGNFVQSEMTLSVDNRDGAFTDADGLCFPAILVGAGISAFTVPTGATCYCETSDGHVIYGTEDVFYLDGTAIPVTAGDEAVGIVCGPSLARTTLTGRTNTYRYDADQADFVIDAPTSSDELDAWEMRGFSGYREPQGAETQIRHNYDGQYLTWDTASGTCQTYERVPMGVFFWQTADKAQDVLTVTARNAGRFDEDATAWLASYTFTSSTTITKFANDLAWQCETYHNAVMTGGTNRNAVISKNPFVGQVVTYKQVAAYIAEATGTNVRISRYGFLEFFQMGQAPATATYIDEGVETTDRVKVTSDRVIRGSRSVAKFETPQIQALIYTTRDGVTYTEGTSTGPTYYMSGNPVLDQLIADAGDDTPVNALWAYLWQIFPYKALSIQAAYADPRIECGDTITFDTSESDATTFTSIITWQEFSWCSSSTANYASDGQLVRSDQTGETYVTPDQLDDKLSDGYVSKSGDTMTGPLVIDGANTDAELDGGQLHFNGGGYDAVYGRSSTVISDGTNEGTYSRLSAKITDGTSTTTMSATALQMNDGTASVSQKNIRRMLPAAGSLSIDLETGMYIAVITRNGDASNDRTGLYIIQSHSNGTSILPVIPSECGSLSASGQTLTFTTTRSYVTLRMIYLSA